MKKCFLVLDCGATNVRAIALDPEGNIVARAAVATGVDGVFMETHVNPAEALSDKANAVAFKDLKRLWQTLGAIHGLVR